jgi:hypothetical protein
LPAIIAASAPVSRLSAPARHEPCDLLLKDRNLIAQLLGRGSAVLGHRVAVLGEGSVAGALAPADHDALEAGARNEAVVVRRLVLAAELAAACLGGLLGLGISLKGRTGLGWRSVAGQLASRCDLNCAASAYLAGSNSPIND